MAELKLCNCQQTNPMNGARHIKIACFIFLFAWISFFPEPVQAQYWFYAKIFFGIFLLVLSLGKKFPRGFLSRQDLPLWLFLACVFSGTISALDKNLAFQTYLYILFTFAGLFYIGKNLCDSDQDRMAICIIICICGSLVALIGSMELYYGRNILYEQFISNPFYAKFIGPALPAGIERYERYTCRPMSTQSEPSILAAYLLFCLPFSLYLFRSQSLRLRLLGIFSSLFYILMIILSLSRIALLGLVASLLVYLWYNKQRKRIIAVFFCLAVLMLAGTYFQKSKLSRYGFSEMIYGKYDSLISEHRFTRVAMTARIIKEHPFFGLGFNHFRIRFNEYCDKEEKGNVPYEYMVPDNMYLAFLAETGIVGTAGFLIFIIFLLRRILKAFNRMVDGASRRFLSAASAALAGLLVHMAGYELFYWYNPYMLFCLTCGFIASVTQDKPLIK